MSSEFRGGSLKVGALSLEFGVGSICEMIRSRLSIVAFASRERNFIFEAVCSCATHVEKTDRTRPIGKSDDRLVYTRMPPYQAFL